MESLVDARHRLRFPPCLALYLTIQNGELIFHSLLSNWRKNIFLGALGKQIEESNKQHDGLWNDIKIDRLFSHHSPNTIILLLLKPEL